MSRSAGAGVTVCPKCRVSYSVYLEQELIARAGCFAHRVASPPPDPDAARRLRRAWAKGPAYAVRPATIEARSAAADLRDDQRVERDVQLEPSTEDLLLALH
jgi:hypothetical protein